MMRVFRHYATKVNWVGVGVSFFVKNTENVTTLVR